MPLTRLTRAERDELLEISRGAPDPDTFDYRRVFWFGPYTVRVKPDARTKLLELLAPESTLRGKLSV